jgi:membrane protein required for colicin V production
VNALDLVLIVIVAFSVIAGFTAGFARVGVGLAAALLGVFCGFWLYGIPAGWLAEYLGPGAAANLLGFFLVFAIFVIAGGVLGGILARVFKWIGLSWLDRMLGAGAGFIRGAFLVIAVVTVITAFAPNPPPRFMVQSRVMPYAAHAASVLAATAPRSLKEPFHTSVEKLRRMWSDGVRFDRRPARLKSQEI